MGEVIPSFEVSLFEPVFGTALDLLEIGVDSGINNDLIKDVPVLSTIIGVGKTVYNIHERNTIKQLITFIKEFNSRTIEKEKLDKYREKIKSDSQKAEKELGRILIILDKTIEEIKSKMLAKLFRAYINEEIIWEEFCEYSEIVNRIFISDINLLYKIASKEVFDTRQCSIYKVERLESIGVITTAINNMILSRGKESRNDKTIMISEIGKKFCNIVK